MPDKHEPDPRFIEKLEWQLSGELRRRNRSGASNRLSVRVIKVAAIMLVSVGLGAGAVEASQQIQESWRAELLQARLAVQVEIAHQRVQMQRETAEQTQEEVESGVREPRELGYAKLQVAKAESDLEIMELQLEEIRESGREPLGELSSPVVNGRDFVRERIEARIRVKLVDLNRLRVDAERATSLTEAGLTDESDLPGQGFAVAAAELDLERLETQLELRQAYLDAEISAVEAELQVLQVEVENRIVLLNRQREYFQHQLEGLQDLAKTGLVNASVLTQGQLRMTEIEGWLRSAEAELQIIQRQLETRAGTR
jgi:hypothetical protein